MKALVIGAGGVGRAIANIASRRSFIESMVIADRTLSRAEEAVARVKDSRFSAAMVNAAELGFEIKPDEAKDISEIGAKITAAANQQLGFTHPENSDWSHISFCELALPIFEEEGIKVSRNTVVIDPGKLDRSPCGTGCSARMAVLNAKGEMKKGDRMIGRSIIDSHFDCAIVNEVNIGNKKAIIPSIRGRAWITGTHQLTLDLDDPWPEGYRLTDTWPMKR